MIDFFIGLQHEEGANKRKMQLTSVLGVPSVMETRPSGLGNVWLTLPGSIDAVLKGGHSSY